MNDLLEILREYISPAELSYSDWVAVGMALKKEGYTAADWDAWSRADGRYKAGECFRKWGSFRREDSDTVSGGTIIEMAKQRGYSYAALAVELRRAFADI